MLESIHYSCREDCWYALSPRAQVTLRSAAVPGVVRRLCGVQAQVAFSAELGVRVRRRASRKGEVARSLSDGRLIKTWAMRGTLHLLTPEDGGAFLALILRRVAKGRVHAEAYADWAEGLIGNSADRPINFLQRAEEVFGRLGRRIDQGRCLMDIARPNATWAWTRGRRSIAPASCSLSAGP